MQELLKKQFEEAFREHLGIIIRISRAYTKTRQDLEDLVNDIAVEIWSSFPTFRSDSKISTWIYRIALNTALNYKRNERRRAGFLDKESLDNIINTLYAEDDNRSELLYNSIDQLDEFNRAIIILYLDGKSHEEIARITGISKSNVGTRIGRIKEQLKKTIIKKV